MTTCDVGQFLGVVLGRYSGLEIHMSDDRLRNLVPDLDKFAPKQHSFYSGGPNEERVVHKGREFSLAEVLASCVTLCPNPKSAAELEELAASGNEDFGSHYTIVASPRSGSDMLCSMIQASEGAGWPQEHLNRVTVALLKCGQIGLRTWLAAFDINSRRKHGPNFGTKFATDDIHYIVESQTLPDIAALHGYISSGRVITLSRADKRAQAVSMIAGRRSGIFNRKKPLTEAERQRLQDIRNSISEDSMQACLAEIEQWEKRYLCPYKGRGVDLTYEDLVGDEQKQKLNEVYDYLNLVGKRTYEPKTVRINS